ARGDNTPDSDIDVMVSLAGRMNARVKEEILKMAFEIELEMDVLFDIKAFSERDIQETLVGATPFMENVLREGFSI
ncbi:MAG: nucleotidyltransferase domain-containing protein, partial [bacterium]